MSEANDNDAPVELVYIQVRGTSPTGVIALDAHKSDIDAAWSLAANVVEAWVDEGVDRISIQVTKYRDELVYAEADPMGDQSPPAADPETDQQPSAYKHQG